MKSIRGVSGLVVRQNVIEAKLGYIHVDTSPSTRIRVPRHTSLHVFQWRPFPLIRVLYRLPVNFTRTSSFCAGRVCIQK